MKANKALVLFVPVLHKGYLDLFIKYKDADLFLLGSNILNNYTSITRDLRVIDPQKVGEMINGLKIFKNIKVLEDINDLSLYNIIISPREDIMEDFLKDIDKTKVVFENVFLRYDKIITQVETQVIPGRTISEDKIDKDIMDVAFAEADKSYDFWRQIGAVITKNEKIVLRSHNRHIPSDFSYMTVGDPRSNFNAGERLDIYTSIHGEADLIAKAAKAGISLENTNVYVTTFPCPNCARLIGEAGIKKVFYSKGYSRLDAENVLKHYGVEIIQVI